MRSRSLTFLLIAAVFTACQTEPAVEDETAADTVAGDTAAPADAGVEDSIRAVNERFESAVLAGDSTAVAALYTEDAVFLAPGTPRVQGRMGIRSAFARMVGGMTEFDLETDRVEVAESGEIAYEVGSYELAVETPDGATMRDEGKYLVVWEKVDGAWHLAADAFNSDLPPGGGSPPDTTAASPDTTDS